MLKALGYSKTKTPIPPEQLLKNVFTEKLLSSSPSAMPLQLQHGPGEPNSAHEWLMRWTVLQVRVADSQPKEISNSKDQGGKKDQAIHNQSGRRLRSDKIENGSSHPNVESEKVKSSTKKIPHHSLKSISEHQGNEIEKVKRNLKKVSKPILESSVKSELDTDSSMQNLQKSTSTLAPELSEKGSNTPCCGPEKPADLETPPEGLPMATSVNELCSLPADIETLQSQVGDTNDSRQDLTKSFCTEALELSEGCDRTPTIEPTKPADVETLPKKLSNLALITELCDTQASKIKPEPVADKNEDITTPDKGVNNNHEQNEDENIKHNQRRASLPLKNDVDVGMRTARKVPSYMAPTQSARAKVREQASPRFEQEVLENNALTRRYSMPSSTNGKMSSSPQHQRLVQACGREGIKIDRSLSSSRDGADKVVRPEWKR
nr:protein IQ-DOMAIN 31-like isoform X1 [Ipomoea batatas]